MIEMNTGTFPALGNPVYLPEPKLTRIPGKAKTYGRDKPQKEAKEKPRKYEPEVIPQTAEEAIPKAAAASKTGVKARTATFGMAILFAAAIAALILLINSFQELSGYNRVVRAHGTELQKLQRETRELSRQLDVSVSLAEVEFYALSELGMIKPTASQIINIDLAGTDRAEVIRQESFWDPVRRLFGGLLNN